MSAVITGENVNLSVYGGETDVTVTASNNASVTTVGDLMGSVTATEEANIVALGDANSLAVHGGSGVSLVVEGSFDGTVTTTSGDVSLFATGDVTGEITSGKDATVGSLGSIAGASITAIGGAADVLALGQFTAGMISAEDDVFLWTLGGIPASTFASLTGGVTAITNGAGDIEVTADKDVLAASLAGPMTVDIDAGGSVDLFGIGVFGQVEADGNLNGVSFNTLYLASVDVGGNAKLIATDYLQADGTVDGDVKLATYSQLLGSLTAGDDLSAWAFGAIGATLVAMDNVEKIVTYSSLTGIVHAGAGADPASDTDGDSGYGDVQRVYIWDDLTGKIIAYDCVGQVYMGGEITATGSIVAPNIGQIAEHDRSPFVDYPKTPVAEIGHLISLARNSQVKLLDLQADLQATRTEVMAIVAATQADVAAHAAQVFYAQMRALYEGDALMVDAGEQLDLAINESELRAKRALAKARIAQQAAEKETQDAAVVALQEVALQSDAAKQEAEKRQKHGESLVAYVTGEATAMQSRFDTTMSMQLDQMDVLKQCYTTVFVATFFDRMKEFALDVTQDRLEMVGTFADFIPVVGTAVSIICDGINASIYAARGRYWDAAFSVGSMIPFGNLAKRAGLDDVASSVARGVFKQFGNGVSAVSRFVPVPPLGKAARKLPCPVRRLVGLPGCFVGHTEVHYLAAGRPAWLATAASVFVVGATGLVVTRPRRDDEEAVDEFMANAGRNNRPDDGPPEPNIDSDSGSFENLCDRLFNGDDSQETDWVAESMYDNTAMDNTEAFFSRRGRGERSGGGGAREIACQRSGTVPIFAEALRSENGTVPFTPTRQCAPVGRVASLPISASGCATTLPQVADVERVTATLDPPASKNRSKPADEPVPKPGSKKKKRRRFSVLGLVWMCAALAVSGFCLFMGLTGFHPDTKPIDQFHVGMIVPPDALHGDNDLLYGEKVHPKTWRHLFVEGKKDDGSRWDADLLVPLWWITEHDAKLGGQVHISVPECNIDGQARVVTLGPCPQIDDIDGRVVTSVFRHHSANVLDLRIEGLDEPVGTTANHPFFSVDHADFVRADELQPGELLRLIDGTPIHVGSSTPRPGTHTVYNLQVSVDHVYHVSKAGVLVHNSEPCALKAVTDSGNIKSYKELQKELRDAGLSRQWEAHKLVEKRHGIGSYRETPAVPLRKGFGGHQDITNQLRKDLPYGTRHSADAVRESIQKTYQRQDWIDAAIKWFDDVL